MHLLNWAVSLLFYFSLGEKCMINEILCCWLPLRCSLFLALVIQQLQQCSQECICWVRCIELQPALCYKVPVVQSRHASLSRQWRRTLLHRITTSLPGKMMLRQVIRGYKSMVCGITCITCTRSASLCRLFCLRRDRAFV